MKQKEDNIFLGEQAESPLREFWPTRRSTIFKTINIVSLNVVYNFIKYFLRCFTKRNIAKHLPITNLT